MPATKLMFLQVQQVTKSYAVKERTIKAVADITFTGCKGNIIGLAGPSGSGKTSLIRAISGLISFDGKIIIDGIDNKLQREKALEKIGTFLNGSRTVYWSLTPLENMRYFAALKKLRQKQAKSQIDLFLNIFDLERHKNIPIKFLSSGNMQKAAIACALIATPPLLLLDEPNSNIDANSCSNLADWLKFMNASGKHCIIVVSHNFDFLEQICNKILILKQGSILNYQDINEYRKSHRNKWVELLIRGPINNLFFTNMNNFNLVSQDKLTHHISCNNADPRQLGLMLAKIAEQSCEILDIRLSNSLHYSLTAGYREEVEL